MPDNLLQRLYKIPAKTGLLIAIIVSLITFSVSGKTPPAILAYFSFVIGMTFQVSDVQITSRQIRHLALFHGFISFVYNTVILALSITIITGLIQK